MEILPFLEEVGGHEDERVARHAKLAHERLVDLTGHAADRPLTPQHPAEEPRGLGDAVCARASGSLTSRMRSKFAAISESSSNAPHSRSRAASPSAAQGGRGSHRCDRGVRPASRVVVPGVLRPLVEAPEPPDRHHVQINEGVPEASGRS